MLQREPIRTGSTAKTRRLRFVCLSGTQSLIKRDMVNPDALFFNEAKVDGTCPKPPGPEGMSTPTPTFS